MPLLPAVILSLVGAVLIGATLRDVFDTLFHPGGRATFSRVTMRVVWRVFHRLARSWPKSFSLAGPIALTMIVGGWAISLVVGWAFVFWPHIDTGFSFQPGTEHGGLEGLIDAVYASLVTLSTLGYGDVTPDAAWLRLITPLESLLGFGLLTASVSWLAAIYPVLSRRRSLAYEIYLLRQAGDDLGVDVAGLEAQSIASIYADLTSRIVTVERDLESFPIAYYFTETDDRFALPAVMPWLRDFALRGTHEDAEPHARLRAVMLSEAITDFAATTAERFIGVEGGDTGEVLDAYGRDHRKS